jgi:hypothetical protein
VRFQYRLPNKSPQYPQSIQRPLPLDVRELPLLASQRESAGGDSQGIAEFQYRERYKSGEPRQSRRTILGFREYKRYSQYSKASYKESQVHRRKSNVCEV